MIDISQPLASLEYCYGRPQLSADFRCCHEDFVVEERLGFEPGGEGEHQFLWVEKRGENTIDVAKQIAGVAGVRNREVSYSGMKDRHGVTRQWFSVPVAIKKTIDWSLLEGDSIKVLQQTRHIRKLRRGVHKGNRFVIVLRQVSDMAGLLARLEQVAAAGVPNYFGAQRFGFDGYNLQMAQRMFDGEPIRSPKLKGIVLSAARSLLFNLVLSERLKQRVFTQPMNGDLFRLRGCRSFFSSDVNEDILSRLHSGDLQIAASLPGIGFDDPDQLVQGQALAFERQVLAPYQLWLDGLMGQQLKADCRAIKLKPDHLEYQPLADNALQLSFELSVGCFATALLRELALLTDCSDKSYAGSKK